MSPRKRALPSRILALWASSARSWTRWLARRRARQLNKVTKQLQHQWMLLDLLLLQQEYLEAQTQRLQRMVQEQQESRLYRLGELTTMRPALPPELQLPQDTPGP